MAYGRDSHGGSRQDLTGAKATGDEFSCLLEGEDTLALVEYCKYRYDGGYLNTASLFVL